MASKRRLRRKACDGKVKHRTLQDALRMSGKYGGMKAGLNAYKCRFCNQYHVGHMPAWMKRGMDDVY